MRGSFQPAHVILRGTPLREEPTQGKCVVRVSKHTALSIEILAERSLMKNLTESMLRPFCGPQFGLVGIFPEETSCKCFGSRWSESRFQSKGGAPCVFCSGVISMGDHDAEYPGACAGLVLTPWQKYPAEESESRDSNALPLCNIG